MEKYTTMSPLRSFPDIFNVIKLIVKFGIVNNENKKNEEKLRELGGEKKQDY